MSRIPLFLAEARSYCGVRWRHQGRSREGVDCVGLPIVCAQTVYDRAFPTPDYDTVSEDETMVQTCEKHLLRVAPGAELPGDIVVLGFQKQRHMAILAVHPLGCLSMIHAYLPNRRVVEARLDAAWASRVIGFYRIPEEQWLF